MFVDGSAGAPQLADRVTALMSQLDPSDGYGPLACGGDILIAEALLARGAKLHVVLPFAEDDFIEQSVLCGGEAWLQRYQACRAAASSIHFATSGAYVGDDNQFAYGTRMGMGLAALRSRQTGGEALQVAILDHSAKSFSRTGRAGTSADTRVWEKLGKRTIVVEAGSLDRTLRFPPGLLPDPEADRVIRSIIFADYKGYSALSERDLPFFMQQVMGPIGRVLDLFGDHVEFRNTWGDAVFAIIDEPVVAAQVALALQERLSKLIPALRPPGTNAGMRIGLHYGPIFRGTDHVTGAALWYGGEVNRTARIEPITPVGGVYCTETFAAALLLDANYCDFVSVGRKPLAKNSGEVELYELHQPSIVSSRDEVCCSLSDLRTSGYVHVKPRAAAAKRP
jgi:class 3 adenylate cyclase